MKVQRYLVIYFLLATFLNFGFNEPSRTCYSGAVLQKKARTYSVKSIAEREWDMRRVHMLSAFCLFLTMHQQSAQNMAFHSSVLFYHSSRPLFLCFFRCRQQAYLMLEPTLAAFLEIPTKSYWFDGKEWFLDGKFHWPPSKSFRRPKQKRKHRRIS